MFSFVYLDFCLFRLLGFSISKFNWGILLLIRIV